MFLFSFYFRSRTKKPDPEDIKMGVKIVENLCYHDPKLFTIPEHTIGRYPHDSSETEGHHGIRIARLSRKSNNTPSVEICGSRPSQHQQDEIQWWFSQCLNSLFLY